MTIKLSKERLAAMEKLNIKMGRPTKYSKGICKILPYMFLAGESVAEVCVQIGICKDTFYRWKDEYPDFSDAYKRGLVFSESWWTVLGRQGAAGKTDINAATWIFNMKNRFKWADKIKQTLDLGELPSFEIIMPEGFKEESEDDYKEPEQED